MITFNDKKEKKFEKTQLITDGVISSLQFMIFSSNDPAPIVGGICHRYKLTPKFISEFKQYLAPNMVMESPRLTLELTEAFPEFFDYELFKEGILNKPNDKNEEEEEESNTTDENSEEETDTAPDVELPNIDLNKLSLSMIIKLRSDGDLSNLITNKMIIDSIYDATSSELNDENLILSLMGISSEIDEILLRNINDQEIKDSILLALSVSDDSNLTSATYRYYSNDMKESILGTTDVDPKELIKSLAESKDLGWKEKMINNILEGNITLCRTMDNFEKDILTFFSMIPEDLVAKVLSLRFFMPNTISYKVLLWVIENKFLSEDNYITAFDSFKSAGLIFNLKKIAKQNDYKKLEEVISAR